MHTGSSDIDLLQIVSEEHSPRDYHRFALGIEPRLESPMSVNPMFPAYTRVFVSKALYVILTQMD